MSRCLYCLYIIILCINEQIAEQNENIEDMELLMVFMVNRHGDRTPEKAEISLSNEPELLDKLCLQYGYGQLTDTGKSHSFALGKDIRRRYGSLLSPTYTPSDIYVECTAVDRTAATAKIAVTGAYCPQDKWSADIELVPLVYTQVSEPDNLNMAWVNCPKYWHYLLSQWANCPKEMQVFNPLLAEVSRSLSKNLTNCPLDLYYVYDVGNCQLSLGLPLSDEQVKLWDKIKQGADAAANTIAAAQETNKELLVLTSGNLLKEFFDTVDLITSGAVTPRVRLFSAHDFNVNSFTAICGAIPRQSLPNFCSSFTLELRKSRKSETFFVVPVYTSSPGQEPLHLEIEGCGDPCDLDTFTELTSNSTLDADDYKERCKYDDFQLLDNLNLPGDLGSIL
ncbi:testicular acid phosphatase homolog [Anticarsia gemmatalis]|uniref:testicular acid phosphatase homolog n=1 Tax=Anticarsia gemmatalis TaxID=129554 RepID=UPI003F762E74